MRTKASPPQMADAQKYQIFSKRQRFSQILIGLIFLVGLILALLFAWSPSLVLDYFTDSAVETNLITSQVTIQKNQERSTSPSTPTPLTIPNQKAIPGRKHVFQSFNNCGPASLSMALSYFGKDFSQQQLGDDLRPYQNAAGNNDDKSVTLTELAQKAEELGLITYHRPAGSIELITQFIAQDIPVVTRTWLKPNEDIGHYRVVRGYNAETKTIIQDDSLQGKDLEYTYEEFEKIWQAFNYEFLVLVSTEKQAVAEQILGDLADEQTAWQIAYQKSEQKLQQNPNDHYALFNQVVALTWLNRHSEAIAKYEQVESRLPNRMLWYQIEPIISYYEVGNYDKVMEITQTVFDSENRANSELHWLRGLIYESQGETEKAESEFNLAILYNEHDYWRVNLH